MLKFFKRLPVVGSITITVGKFQSRSYSYFIAQSNDRARKNAYFGAGKTRFGAVVSMYLDVLSPAVR